MPNASNLLYTMLVAVLFVGCKKDALYTTEECFNFKNGDTIYMSYGGELTKAVIIKNNSKKQILEVYRRNVLDENVYMNEIFTYDDIRFE